MRLLTCDWVPSSPELRNLQLEGWYETMPTAISSLSFPLLSHLDINVHQVRLEDIQVLGTLPALHVLRLISDVDTSIQEECTTKRSFMLTADAFPCAVQCIFPNVLFAPYIYSHQELCQWFNRWGLVSWCQISSVVGTGTYA
jgi:hypothetical protein